MKTKISFLLALFIGFVACSKENGGPSAGIVTEENSVAQTWMPEVAVDSVKVQLKPNGLNGFPSDEYWYEFNLRTKPNLVYFNSNRMSDCGTEIYEKENALRYVQRDSARTLVSFIMILDQDSTSKVVTEELVVRYSTYDKDLFLGDSLRFVDHCNSMNGSIEDLARYQNGISFRCFYNANTEATAYDYLYNNAMALKPYCEF